MIRVVVADDSALFRAVLKSALEGDSEIQVVGRASNGDEAIEAVVRTEPDIVTMDVVMPGRGGEDAIKEIMKRRPTPIVVVSSLDRNAIVFRMLAAGALDVVAKPDGSQAAMAALVKKVKDLAQAKESIRSARRTASGPRPQPNLLSPPGPGTPPALSPSLPPVPPSPSPHAPVRPKTAAEELFRNPAGRPAAAPEAGPRESPGSARLVVIASSAGGPPALEKVLSHLPARFPVPVIVVQHIAAGFASGLAAWLGATSPNPVGVPHGDPLAPGSILVAPDDADVEVLSSRQIQLLRGGGTPGAAHPIADVTLRSAAAVFGEGLLAVILTGMGSDGAAGAAAVKARGGRVVVQDEATSAVYGMPRAARPFADAVLPLDEIAAEIVRFASRSGS